MFSGVSRRGGRPAGAAPQQRRAGGHAAAARHQGRSTPQEVAASVRPRAPPGVGVTGSPVRPERRCSARFPFIAGPLETVRVECDLGILEVDEMKVEVGR